MPVLSAIAGRHQYGRVARIESLGQNAATGTGATEGVNQLTYPVERTGHYRINSAVTIMTTGVGAGQVVNAQAAYNNGAAKGPATIAINGVTPGTLALTGAAGGELAQSQVIKAVRGTNIVLSLLGAGTFTTPAVIDWYAEIEAL